jgi:polyhydroxybutyrate depolymerase
MPPPNQPPPTTCSGKSAGKAGNVAVNVSSNGDRTSKLHVPGSYDPNKAAMLVLNFHGYFGDAGGEEAVTKMDASSDKHGFLVAYPQGIGNSFNADYCCGDAMNNHVDDVAFTKALIAKLENDYCIDEKRIYTTGMSNGGHMSYKLACEMSDVFAAAAPVAGEVLQLSCNPKRQIPILHVHGTADPIVSYDGGGYRSTAASLGVFEAAYGCSNAPNTNWYSKGDATCYSFDGCTTEVAHCKIDGGGHTWPGGLPLPFGKTSTDLDATETIIAFFQKHPMP